MGGTITDAKRSIQPLVAYADGSNVADESDDDINSPATFAEALLKADHLERNKPNEEVRREILALTDQINATSDPSELAELYFSRGHDHSIVEDREQAVRDFFAALDRATERPQIIRIKIMISLELAKARATYEASLSFAVDAVNDDTGDADAWDNLGLVSGICEYYGFAIEALRRAIQIQPGLPSATLRLGIYLREKSQLQESIEVLSSYVAQHPHDAKAWYELGKSTHYSIANAGCRERAMEHYRRALTEHPDEFTRLRIGKMIRDIEDAEANA